MEKRLAAVTLGVRDLARAQQFYEQGLGWTRDAGEADIAFYQLAGSVLGLYEWPKLARDSASPDHGQGFRGVTLGYCTRSVEEVDAVLSAAERAGGEIRVRARRTFWGGYSGYFADLDGHLWEVMWNPQLEISSRGEHLIKPPVP